MVVAGRRSKRRRVASSGDASDSLSAVCGGAGEGGGKKALYHCNYCNKDISGKIRIKCSKCPDFDLCVECFSVGAEVTPHRSNHPYRVMVSTRAYCRTFPCLFLLYPSVNNAIMQPFFLDTLNCIHAYYTAAQVYSCFTPVSNFVLCQRVLRLPSLLN
jgi:hypothetical protein